MGLRWRLGQRWWKTIIALLVLVGLLDSYALARAYVSKNAGAVSIVATGHYGNLPSNSAGRPLPVPAIKPVVRLHYTGALVQRLQRFIEDYPRYNPNSDCTAGQADTVYRYDYVFTFSIGAIPVQTIHTSSYACVWTIVALGIPSGLVPGTSALLVLGDDLMNAINGLTNGAFPTPEHPVYA